MTNEDWLRGLPTEELAWTLANEAGLELGECPVNMTGCPHNCGQCWHDAWIKWLKEERDVSVADKNQH